MQKLLIGAALSASLLTGCSSWRIPWIYRMDIQQGNVFTQEEVNQLRPGMSKRQAAFLLGTPLLVDVFHPDRWDYYYAYRPEGGRPSKRQRLTLYFKQDSLTRIEGAMRPLAGGPASPERHETTVVVPPKQEDKGMLKRVWGSLNGEDSQPADYPERGGDSDE